MRRSNLLPIHYGETASQKALAVTWETNFCRSVLAVKTLDQIFIMRLKEGLGCSMFEAEAITELIREGLGYRIAPAGALWGVTDPVLPGESLKLVTGDGYYRPAESSALPYPVGASVWAYVDSVNWATTWGAVREIDEGNNTFGPVASVVGANGIRPLSLETQGKQGNLPER